MLPDDDDDDNDDEGLDDDDAEFSSRLLNEFTNVDFPDCLEPMKTMVDSWCVVLFKPASSALLSASLDASGAPCACYKMHH